MAELWDIYTKDRIKTGRTVERGQPMKQDEYHISVHIWMRNGHGEWLISKRTPNKTFPELWETTGGAVLSGEDSLNAAIREVKEELGVELKPEYGRLWRSYTEQNALAPKIVDVWVFETDWSLKNVRFQDGETCDAMLASDDMIYRMIDNEEFISLKWFPYVTSLLTYFDEDDRKAFMERRDLAMSYLGKTVTGKIDRPVGYEHKKADHTVVYGINYGYIPGVMGGDGEELDVYFPGVAEPASELTGKVEAIIMRDDDNEDKLVALPEGVSMTADEIAEAVRFQEKYHRSRVYKV